MKNVNKIWAWTLLAALIIGSVAGPGRLAVAQKAGPSSALSKSVGKAKSGGKTRRIIILGTTIVGSVTSPRVVYEAPWREPDSFREGMDIPQRSFYNEIFSPLETEPPKSEADPLR